LVNVAKSDELLLDEKALKKVSYEELIKTNNNFEQDKLLINSAWLTALKNEYTLIDNIIKTRLNNKSSEDLVKDKTEIEKELAKAKNELETINKKSMSSEEYYKKRRELDILKIEKENLEYTVKGGNEELEKKIDEINAKLGEAEEKKEVISAEVHSMPLILINLSHASPEIIVETENISANRQVIRFELVS